MWYAVWVIVPGVFYAVARFVVIALILRKYRGRERWTLTLTAFTFLPTGPSLMPLKAYFPGVGMPSDPYGAPNEQTHIDTVNRDKLPPDGVGRKLMA